jgi:hypothetical protein
MPQCIPTQHNNKKSYFIIQYDGTTLTITPTSRKTERRGERKFKTFGTAVS